MRIVLIAFLRAIGGGFAKMHDIRNRNSMKDSGLENPKRIV